MKGMNILLVYPKFPTTYWGFQHAMPFIGKRSSLPPLGLISLAALLPAHWRLRLVDLNTTELSDEQICWADAVFVGGMRIQAPSMHEVLARAKALGVTSAVGGPAPTTSPHEFPDADVVFCGEAEGRIEQLLSALTAHAEGAGSQVVPAPPAAERPSMQDVPIPRFDLLKLEHYASVAIQYSRGCPFRCEFCDIIEMFGRVPRLKSPVQIMNELDALRNLGWKNSVFVVDDNFIGNKKEVRKLLPHVTAWQKKHGYPFEFYTEASVNLASDDELIKSMVEAGFASVFLGIETPSPEALKGAQKTQNASMDLTEAVNHLTGAGLEVMAGFIVGFDEDGPDAFEAQREFIANSAIPLAMVGLLIALPDTALWRRLESEGRLRTTSEGDAFGRPNFVPTMDEESLIAGYSDLMRDLYTPEAYYKRCRAYVDRAARVPGLKSPQPWHFLTAARAILKIGIGSRRRGEFWKLIVHAARRAPHTIPWVFGHAVQGEHMIRYTQESVLPELADALADIRAEKQHPETLRVPQPIPSYDVPVRDLFKPRVPVLQPVAAAAE